MRHEHSTRGVAGPVVSYPTKPSSPQAISLQPNMVSPAFAFGGSEARNRPLVFLRTDGAFLSLWIISRCEDTTPDERSASAGGWKTRLRVRERSRPRPDESRSCVMLDA